MFNTNSGLCRIFKMLLGRMKPYRYMSLATFKTVNLHYTKSYNVLHVKLLCAAPFKNLTAWMELDSIMLSEISQMVKDKYQMISPISRT